MLLNVLVSGTTIPVNVPDMMLTEAQEFFKKMDKDMDKGWQMSQTWVDKLNAEQRCQVVGDKILTAIDTENKQLMVMMAAYVLYKMPGSTAIRISEDGDINETEVIVGGLN